MSEMDNLRKQIEDTTKEFKVPKQKTVSRIFYIPVSSELEPIRTWYQKWFPCYNNVLSSVYCWLSLTKATNKEHIKEIVSKGWRNSLSASILTEITADGYRLLEACSQVIFLIDLTNPDGVKRIIETKEVLEDLISQLGGHLSFRFTCIAVLRNYDVSKGEILEPINLNEFQDWSKDNIDRLYVIDVVNSRGTTISNSDDLIYLIGQLVYHLTKKPLEFCAKGDIGAFHEWMKKIDPQKDRVSSFSGISVVFPIDYVLHICLVKKGAQTLEKVLFSTAQADRVMYYTQTILSEYGFQSIPKLKDTIRNGLLKEVLLNPVKILFREIDCNITDSLLDNALHRILLYKSAQASLRKHAEANAKIYRDHIGSFTGDFEYAIQDYMGEILTKEIGSFAIITSFIKELKIHFKGLIQNINDAKRKEFNLPKLIEKLEKKTNKFPTKKALILWVLIFISTLSIIILNSISSTHVFKLIAAGFILLATTSLVFRWYALKRRINKLFSMIEAEIIKEWEGLMADVDNQFIDQINQSCIEICSDNEKKVTEKIQRFNNIIQFGKEEYNILPPENSAFWINAVTNREEAASFTERIPDKSSFLPVNILDKTSPIEFLNRISNDKEPELNQFEMKILENLAIEFIPECSKLLRLSVCDALSYNKDLMNNISVLFADYSNPFVSINALHFPEIFLRRLEIPTKHCEHIYDMIIKTFDRDEAIEKEESGSNFRITLLTFAEGIDFNIITSSLVKPE